ncbi:MAG TPA: membrane dipeptidase, partial [Thermoanaerobaculia bacterium]|nr:membrane dipeptidase [Thermoanaerobaculia bacterium]
AGAGVLAAPMTHRGRFRLFADDSAEISAHAIDLVGRSMVIDMLGLLTLDWPTLYGWQRTPATFSEADFLKLLRTGIRIFHPAVEPNQSDAYEASLRWTTGWNRFLGAHPEYLLRVDSAADFHRTREEGKIGILVGFQNADHFRTAADVETFYEVGQRVSQLTYNTRNRLGCGCKVAEDGGLTPYGGQIVGAMNRVGMAVDISHSAERTSLDAIRVSRKPVLVTHSNCRALVPHPRCKSDKVIKALAERGGVMGITVIPAFLKVGRPARIEHVLDHFDHVVRVAGIEHVGIGSDADVDAIDPRTRRVRTRYNVLGLKHSRRVFELTDGLIRRGYTDSQIELVLGGNFQRALTEIWGRKPAVVQRPAGT